MASSKCYSSLLFISLTFLSFTVSSASLTLTVVNNCPYPVWPAIQPSAGFPVLERGGFRLDTHTHRSFPAPNTLWSGRVWARTDCFFANGRFSCATGGCGDRLECDGLGGAPPATLVQYTLHHGGHRDLSSYGVSVVDGFNVPLTVTPHEGQGVCPVVGCKENLLATCPPKLQFRSGDGRVIGCKSGCLAVGSDALCCRNHYNSPQTCRSSSFSQFFKQACPSTFTYAHDTPSLMHDCSSPKELKIIFCH